MKPFLFDGYTNILGAPVNWSAEKYGFCDGLPILSKNGLCISVWKLSWRERLAILTGANIQLRVVSAHTHAPVALCTTRVAKSPPPPRQGE